MTLDLEKIKKFDLIWDLTENTGVLFWTKYDLNSWCCSNYLEITGEIVNLLAKSNTL